MPDDLIHCPLQSGENADLLLEYTAQRLPESQRRVLDQHVATCPACRQFREEQELVWKALDTWESGAFQPGFDYRLQQRLEADQRIPAWERMGWWVQDFRLKPVPVAAAILLVALGLGWGLSELIR
jgi:anti-sigma factor RsiW